MSDYRTLLAEQFHSNSPNGTANGAYLDIARHNEAERILTTRIPWLCSDCNNLGIKHPPAQWGTWPIEACTHPNTPTIADLLRWGEQVAKVEIHAEKHWVCGRWFNDEHAVLDGKRYDGDEVGLLAALRTEADQ